LLAGSSVYLLDRDWTSTLFLAPFASWQPATGVSLGSIGLSLPSLFHAYAFAILIILALQPARNARLAGALSWLLVALAFECLQADIVKGLVADASGAIAGHPFVDSLRAFIVDGHFDAADLLASGAGVFIAWLASSVLEARP